MRFGIVGVGGYIAPRHLQAIKDTGHTLVCALDPNDSVGILDRYGFETEFFTSPERFERHLYRLAREGRGIDWLAVCSPNHLHDVHAFVGLRNGADVICEKPLVLDPRNLDALAEMEGRTCRNVFTVLQLRLHPGLLALQGKLAAAPYHRDVHLRYVTPRGRWYHQSWKGEPTKSGGLIANIGVHLLDALLWLFGPVERFEMTESTPTRASGKLQLRRARVSWELSIDPADGAKPERTITIANDEGPDDVVKIDGAEFANLHTKVYEATLGGAGFGIEEARPSVELAARLRA